MRVMKFGGSSLVDAGAIERVGKLVRDAAAGDRVVVVVSALGGVTDLLLEAAASALTAYDKTTDLVSRLHERHTEVVERLLPASRRSPVAAEIQMLFNNLEDVLHGVNLVRECSPSSRALVVSYGERLSARIVAGYLETLGVDSRYVDSRPLILTGGKLGAETVNLEESFDRLRRCLPADGTVPVVTGFIAADAQGVTTNLGRNGSDSTATLVGAALGATQIELWTNVDGIFSTDPSAMSDARVIRRMTFEEAQELAYFGAEIVHPHSLQPASERGIPVIVRNTFRPEDAGTVITHEAGDGGRAVRGISTIEDVALVNLEGSGMIGVLGVAGRLFTALADQGVNIIMISQASSEHSICFVTRNKELETAVRAVEETFERELEAGLIQRVEALHDLAVLSIIGSKMRGTVGLSGRFFGALGEVGVNVVAISQGSSERNISIVVAGDDKLDALRAVHQAFSLEREQAL